MSLRDRLIAKQAEQAAVFARRVDVAWESFSHHVADDSSGECKAVAAPVLHKISTSLNSPDFKLFTANLAAVSRPTPFMQACKEALDRVKPDAWTRIVGGAWDVYARRLRQLTYKPLDAMLKDLTPEQHAAFEREWKGMDQGWYDDVAMLLTAKIFVDRAASGVFTASVGTTVSDRAAAAIDHYLTGLEKLHRDRVIDSPEVSSLGDGFIANLPLTFHLDKAEKIDPELRKEMTEDAAAELPICVCTDQSYIAFYDQLFDD